MELEIGREYVAIGPNPAAKPASAGKTTSGWWEPTRVTVLKRIDGGYKTTKGVILDKATYMWRPADAEG